MNARIALLALATAALIATAAACGDKADGPGDVTVPPGTQGSNHVLGSPDAPVKIVEYADFQ